MPKKRLTNIAEEYGISFEKASDLVFKELGEEMVTGKGKNTWINEDGQRLIDEIISMPVLYRGPVVSLPPNPAFLMVYTKEITQKVKVRIPRRFPQKQFANKIVYVEADNSGSETQYNWVKANRHS